MGNWAIIIQGTGQHHNDQDNDADRIAAQFTDALVKAGHNVESATFTSGGRLNLPTEHD